MSLELLVEQQVNIIYPNGSRLEDALKPSRLIYDIAPLATIRRKIHRFPTIEEVDEFYEVDKEGLYLVAHKTSKRRDGQVINQEAPNYIIFQHISQNQVQEIKRRSQEGLLYLGSEKTFLLGEARIENPTVLLFNIAKELNKQPAVPDGYLLLLIHYKWENNIGIMPYNPSLIKQAKELGSEYHKKIHTGQR